LWVAEAWLHDEAVQLDKIRPVQDLPGRGDPFERLSSFLNQPEEACAGIDAPFSLPASVLADNASEARERVKGLPRDERPFPTGAALVQEFAPEHGPRSNNILRETEREWQTRGVNVRSTLWAGPRGGAPFTAGCMLLLSRHRGSVWPIKHEPEPYVTLCEAFPAAQLQHWGLPRIKYNGPLADALVARRIIVEGLNERGLRLSAEHERICLGSADALDAVICLYAAAAVATETCVGPPPERTGQEGRIAVHL